jgi:hypothetical protein
LQEHLDLLPKMPPKKGKGPASKFKTTKKKQKQPTPPPISPDEEEEEMSSQPSEGEDVQEEEIEVVTPPLPEMTLKKTNKRQRGPSHSASATLRQAKKHISEIQETQSEDDAHSSLDSSSSVPNRPASTATNKGSSKKTTTSKAKTAEQGRRSPIHMSAEMERELAEWIRGIPALYDQKSDNYYKQKDRLFHFQQKLNQDYPESTLTGKNIDEWLKGQRDRANKIKKNLNYKSGDSDDPDLELRIKSLRDREIWANFKWITRFIKSRTPAAHKAGIGYSRSTTGSQQPLPSTSSQASRQVADDPHNIDSDDDSRVDSSMPAPQQPASSQVNMKFKYYYYLVINIF